MRLLSGMLIGVCWLVQSASAATMFDGKWTAHVERPAPAGPQDLTITLTTDDAGRVRGAIAIKDGGESRIEWGFVKGDLITFKVTMPLNNQPEPFIYVGSA